MKKAVISASLLLCALASAAQALTISQTKSSPALRAPGSSPPVGAVLAFDKFNPFAYRVGGNLGVLDSIKVIVSGQVAADFSMQNTSAGPVKLTSNITGPLYLLNGATTLYTLDPGLWVSAQVTNLAPGNTYTTQKDSAVQSGNATFVDLATRSAFSGSGKINLVADAADLTVSSSIQGGTDYVNATKAFAQETVTVEYNYSDSGIAATPEPGTLMLLGSGLLGFGGSAFSRKRKEKRAVKAAV